MPRQRKAQSGAQRIGTGRVANTTTSSELQTVYRVPTWRGAYWECERLAYEITGVAPIRVAIEWENIYRISFDTDSLKSTIENFDTLNLKDVTADSVTAPYGTFTDLWADVLSVSWNASVGWDLSVTGWVSSASVDTTTLSSTTSTTETLSVTDSASITNNLSVGGTATIADLHLTDVEVTGNLVVDWTSTFVGAIDAADASVENLTVETTASITWLTANGPTTVDWNLSVTGNETIAWTLWVTWAATFTDATVSNELNVADINVSDDLNVSGTTSLAALETSGSVDVGWTLRTTWAAVIGNWLNVTGQMESDTVRTAEVIADEVRVTTGLYLSQWAEAPDFVLQSEKGEPNGVAPLNVNGKIDQQYLPSIYTTAIVKVGTWVFSNSDTSVVVDGDITADSFVALSNYSDIIWDLNEIINVGQLTVVSNQTETWSYKYIIVNPLNACE